MLQRPRILQFTLLLLLLPALVVLSACDSVVDDDGEHGDFARVVLEARDGTGQIIGEWTETDGWDIDALPDMTEGAIESVYTVRIFDGDGDELTLEEGGDFEARYAVDADAPDDVLFFNPSGEVALTGGEEGELFHGDHVHLYPQNAGTTRVRFLLWHESHADGNTDWIDVTVEEAHGDELELARLVLETRDGTGTEVGEWTAASGWSIDALPEMTEGEAETVFTVRIFAEDGDEITLEEGGDFEARYAIDASAPADVLFFDTSGEIERADGTQGELFHGDHVYLYPQSPGTTQVRFLLWHDSHADGETDLIDATVVSEGS